MTTPGKRFIPAGAGNTLIAPWIIVPVPVYPRWRGEHMLNDKYSDAPTGLSPLARGTPEVAHKGANNMRFIPAGAGNTTHLKK